MPGLGPCVYHLPGLAPRGPVLSRRVLPVVLTEPSGPTEQTPSDVFVRQVGAIRSREPASIG